MDIFSLPEADNPLTLRDSPPPLSVASDAEDGGDADPLPPAPADELPPSPLAPPEPQGDSAAADDEATLPLWMRAASARVIAPETPPLSSLGLDPRLVAALRLAGVRRAFPVQAAVIPLLLASHAAALPADLCVCAPTGSGKTLAYALPLVHLLGRRVVPRLRALVLVPTRGLAAQVHAVFSPLCAAAGLRVGLAAGQAETSWEQERAALLGPPPRRAAAAGGRSEVDLLVGTPGRLAEHLHAAGGFTLQHLQFLVVDEADRLLGHGYQGWLDLVLRAAHRPPPRLSRRGAATARPMAGAPLSSSRERTWGGGGGAPTRLLKLLFSATLTRSPAKLAPLRLASPRYLCVEGARYATPASLREWCLTCASEEKPALLVALLRWLACGTPKGEAAWGWRRGEAAAAEAAEGGGRMPQTLVFASSVESTRRLRALLEAVGCDALEYSSAMARRARNATLSRLRDGSARLVVASDALARGMDVEGVAVVVNYDPPADIKGYVHRVGRTARAGREGASYTLLAEREVGFFKMSMARAGKEWRTLRLPRQREAVAEVAAECAPALQQLRAAGAGAKGGVGVEEAAAQKPAKRRKVDEAAEASGE